MSVPIVNTVHSVMWDLERSRMWNRYLANTEASIYGEKALDVYEMPEAPERETEAETEVTVIDFSDLSKEKKAAFWDGEEDELIF